MRDEYSKRPCQGKLMPGTVNRDNEHIELLYGDANEIAATDFMPFRYRKEDNGIGRLYCIGGRRFWNWLCRFLGPVFQRQDVANQGDERQRK